MVTKEYPFEFSVIMAVYNVEKYLKEAVESLIKQSFGFQNIQLILVDDGSKDGSGKLCDNFAKRYPENIKVIHKENGGVSSARNAGIPFAEGRFINFMDSDDKFSRNAFAKVHRFFRLYEEETDVVSVPIHFFDAAQGEHWQNIKFSNGERVIDLEREHNITLMFVNSSFIHNRVKENIWFDPSPACGEDLIAVNRILLEKMRLGVVCNCQYLYRRRSGESDSLIATSKDKISWYNPYLSSVVFGLYEYSLQKCGKFPRFLQFTLAQDLVWKVNHDNKRTKAVLGEGEEYNQYIKNMYRAMSIFDKDIVQQVKWLSQDLQYQWLNLARNGEKREFADLVYPWADMSNCRLAAQYFNLTSDDLSFEFTANLPEKLYRSAELVAEINGERCLCTKETIGQILFFDGNVVALNVRFKIHIPFSDNKNKYAIKFFYFVNGTFIPVQRYAFEKFFPLSFIKNSYYYKNNFILWFERNQFFIKQTDKTGRIRAEFRFMGSLLRTKKIKNTMIAMLRLLYWFRSCSPCKKREYWLMSDRAIKADDNGEAFFEYCRKHKKKQVKAVFAISKKCSDYKRIRKIGKTVSIYGWRYKLRYLLCDKVVSSNGDTFASTPIAADGLKDIVHDKKFVFLQHGVTKDDMSDWLNKYKKNIFKFVTATNAEYKSILHFQYLYSEKNVVLTGFPRYDLLYDQPQKQIVIMPTWRKSLVGTMTDGIWKPIDNFKQTDYFQFYNALLNDEKLLLEAKTHGYSLAFLPHPNMYHAYIEDFSFDASVKILKTDSRYKTVFAESCLLLTDYSSVAFDFAYLGKPVVYCQFDHDKVENGSHIYGKGYFDYERDGFGEVCGDLQSTVETLIGYMRENCALKSKYAERIESTFPYRDRNNCARLFNAIWGK